jgi:nitrite reductase/ring-hydroxylating ferredoxin subunit/DMSO/TMAO reductase YedYZ heme-binding membrane subunit
MGVEYQAVQWNRQKKFYDLVLVGGVATYLVTFGVVTETLFPHVTEEILLMRAFGTAAFMLLHLILCIGPLCRLNPQLLPLLYNRRHAGVSMFLLALIHAALVVATYQAGGDTNPFLSIFTAGKFDGAIVSVPFQPFGFFALLILFLLAATSHDFWLANLSAPVWKSLHMMVYFAYALLVLHVTFGVLQGETHPVFAGAMALGLALVIGLQVAAARKEVVQDRELDNCSSRRVNAHASKSAIGNRQSAIDQSLVTSAATGEFVDACAVAEIPENRARIVCLSGERVAIFKYDGKISALSNVCQHQNGPLGEGKILDGCVTCPWHGYQYLLDTGASPPPFAEKVPTFKVRIRSGRVLVHPKPNPAGTKTEPALIAT